MIDHRTYDKMLRFQRKLRKHGLNNSLLATVMKNFRDGYIPSENQLIQLNQDWKNFTTIYGKY